MHLGLYMNPMMATQAQNHLMAQPEHVHMVNQCSTAIGEDNCHSPSAQMRIACPHRLKDRAMFVSDTTSNSRPCPFPLAAQRKLPLLQTWAVAADGPFSTRKSKAHIPKQKLKAGQGGGGIGSGDRNIAIAGFQSWALQGPLQEASWKSMNESPGRAPLHRHRTWLHTAPYDWRLWSILGVSNLTD